MLKYVILFGVCSLSAKRGVFMTASACEYRLRRKKNTMIPKICEIEFIGLVTLAIANSL